MSAVPLTREDLAILTRPLRRPGPGFRLVSIQLVADGADARRMRELTEDRAHFDSAGWPVVIVEADREARE